MSCGTCSPALHIYDPISCVAERPQPGECPWFLEHLFTAYSKKHVFKWHRSSLNLLQSTAVALEQWRRKRLWEFTLSSTERSDDWHKLKSKGKPIPPCDCKVPSFVHSYLRDSIDTVWDAVSKCGIRGPCSLELCLLQLHNFPSQVGLVCCPIRTADSSCFQNIQETNV